MRSMRREDSAELVNTEASEEGPRERAKSRMRCVPKEILFYFVPEEARDYKQSRVEVRMSLMPQEIFEGEDSEAAHQNSPRAKG
ncbi:hypothetical protein EVAR_23409_1 [Eumeta japonica]|uniref:Uncharacterized protein n=1 Tax=Eumeta variegata TaxID=151549 RepID=A0A4C1VVH4_EUMVA|nr:hypothetical protein EVAR_23409_1 [Eumeta japonica]